MTKNSARRREIYTIDFWKRFSSPVAARGSSSNQFYHDDGGGGGGWKKEVNWRFMPQTNKSIVYTRSRSEWKKKTAKRFYTIILIIIPFVSTSLFNRIVAVCVHECGPAQSVLILVTVLVHPRPCRFVHYVIIIPRPDGHKSNKPILSCRSSSIIIRGSRHLRTYWIFRSEINNTYQTTNVGKHSSRRPQ